MSKSGMATGCGDVHLDSTFNVFSSQHNRTSTMFDGSSPLRWISTREDIKFPTS